MFISRENNESFFSFFFTAQHPSLAGQSNESAVTGYPTNPAPSNESTLNRQD
jgi:hypothetical protein